MAVEPEWMTAHDNRARAFETAAEDQTSAALRLLVADAARRLAAEYAKAAGGLKTPVPAGAQEALHAAVRRIVAALATGMLAEVPRIIDTLTEVATGGMRLGARANPQRAGRRARARLSRDVTAAIGRLRRQLAADVQAVREAAARPVGRYRDVTAIVGTASRVVDRTAATTRWVANRSVNDGAAQVADLDGVPRLWVAERDACCVPGTKVAAPRLLAAPSAPDMVAADVPKRLALDPAPSTVGLWSDRSGEATPTVARTDGDLANVLGVSERDYVGQVVTIRTASGKQLTGTPNHPVATRRGWVGLAELQVGDHVFSRRDGHRSGDGVDPDLNDVQPAIEEVAQAFQVELSSRVVPVAAEDFHGDGVGTQVGVVWAHRALGLRGNAESAQHVGQEHLDRADVESASFDGSGTVDPRLEAGLPADVARRHVTHDALSDLRGHRPAAAEVAPEGDAVASEPTTRGAHVDAIDYGDFLGRLAVLVVPDEVVEIRHDEFLGHVYNLETIEGWYLSADIVSHNCLTCLAYAGHLAQPGEDFPAGLTFGKTSTVTAALYGPPAHPNCRCRLQPWYGQDEPFGVPLPVALRREAARSVLTGASEYASRPAKLGAAERMLKTALAVPDTVKQRAAAKVRAGVGAWKPARRRRAS